MHPRVAQAASTEHFCTVGKYGAQSPSPKFKALGEVVSKISRAADSDGGFTFILNGLRWKK